MNIISLLPRVAKIVAKIAGIDSNSAIELLQEKLQKDPSLVRDLEAMVKYSGEFSELPRGIQVLRACVRPLITLGFSAAIFIGVALGTIDWSYLVALYGPILGFWFGERNISKVLENGKKRK